MKGSKIFLAWLCTVLLGSIGLTISFNIFGSSGRTVYSEDFGIFCMNTIISFIISGLLTLPALITLLISNAILNKKKLQLKRHFRKINIVHILATIISLIILESISLFVIYDQMHSSKEIEHNWALFPLLGVAFVVLWYFLCAVLFWVLFFLKEIKEIRNAKIVKEETATINTES